VHHILLPKMGKNNHYQFDSGYFYIDIFFS
jgi:hypothetical protein